MLPSFVGRTNVGGSRFHEARNSARCFEPAAAVIPSGRLAAPVEHVFPGVSPLGGIDAVSTTELLEHRRAQEQHDNCYNDDPEERVEDHCETLPTTWRYPTVRAALS